MMLHSNMTSDPGTNTRTHARTRWIRLYFLPPVGVSVLNFSFSIYRQNDGEADALLLGYNYQYYSTENNFLKDHDNNDNNDIFQT